MEEIKKKSIKISNSKSIDDIKSLFTILDNISFIDIRLNFPYEKYLEIVQIFENSKEQLSKIHQLTLVALKLSNAHDNIKNMLSILNYFSELERLVIVIGPINKFNEENIANFAQILPKFKNLKSLFLNFGYNNSLDINGFTTIVSTLKELSKLEELSLSISKGNQLSEKGVCSLAESIKQLKELKRIALKFGDNIEVTEIGMLNILQSIQVLSHLTKLKLKLQGNNNVDRFFQQQFSKEFQQLQNIGQLEYLQFEIGAWNSLSSIGAQQLSQGIKYAVNLKVLEIKIGQNNLIMPEGFGELGNSFSYLQQLNELYIQIDDYNNLGWQGLKQFSQNLVHLRSSLTKFAITIKAANFIKQEGAYELSLGISKLVNLNSLAVHLYNNNEIVTSSLICFSQCLENLKSLQTLALYFVRNSFIAQNILEFMKNLSQITSLKKISLELCADKLENHDFQYINHKLSLLQNLQYLGLKLITDIINQGQNPRIGKMIFGNLQNPNLRQLSFSIVSTNPIDPEEYIFYAKRKLLRLTHVDGFLSMSANRFIKY